MTPEQLAEIEARWKRSTDGEWISMYDDDRTGPVVAIQYDLDGKEERSEEICVTPEADDRESDFDFIAHAHQDIPALIAEIGRLTASLQHIADGNISPSIGFARSVLEGKSVDEAHRIESERIEARWAHRESLPDALNTAV
jgi:hypothetical protein